MLRRYLGWVNQKTEAQIDKASIIMEDESTFKWLVYLTSAISVGFSVAVCGSYTVGFYQGWSWRKNTLVSMALFTTFAMFDTLFLRDRLIERRLDRYCYPAAAFFHRGADTPAAS